MAPSAGSIRADHVSKRFARPAAAPRTLKEWLVTRVRRPAGEAEPFWALRDVSFEIGRGEAVGLVGDNGSGKSTMLKLVTGIMKPSEGHVTVEGRVSALLELGAGFHPEFTGRENVFLNGAILGLKRAEIARRFDAIAEFAEIGAFIDAPVKTYSSGMYMRLAFAIAVNVDPDVLVVDEVLAVGDARFQRKCYERIRRFREAGKTILLVTHDAAAVRELCDRAIWLERGRLMAVGPAGEVLERYASREPAGGQAAGGRPIAIRAFAFRGDYVHAPGVWLAGHAFAVGFDLELDGDPHGLALVLKVVKSDGVTCYTSRQPLAPAMAGPGRARVAVAIPRLPLLSGEYLLEVAVAEGPLYLEVRKHPFRVHCDADGEGVAPLDCRWTVEPALPAPQA